MAKTYRELDVWQLAFDISRDVFRLTQSPAAIRDRKYCDQVRSSAASVAGNIAEGFGRYHPGDFARFLGIARGSLDETDVHIREGVVRSYFPAEAAGPVILKVARCRSAVCALQSYLLRTAATRKKHPREEPS